jgi:hypothetical protein
LRPLLGLVVVVLGRPRSSDVTGHLDLRVIEHVFYRDDVGRDGEGPVQRTTVGGPPEYGLKGQCLPWDRCW